MTRFFNMCLRLASQSQQSAGFFYGDQDFFDLLIVPSLKRCIKLPMQSSFLENVGGYFFYLDKTLNGVVLGVFHGDLHFFDLHEKPLTTQLRVLPA